MRLVQQLADGMGTLRPTHSGVAGNALLNFASLPQIHLIATPTPEPTMIYVLTNTVDPTGYFRTNCPRQAVSVARQWRKLGRLHAIDVIVGGGDQPLRTVRVPLGKQRETVAAIRAVMA